MIDHESGIPLYLQVADALRKRITTGEIAAGAELLSESEIAAVCGVSREVVRKGLTVLRSEGLIVSVRGRRSAVRRELPVEQVSVVGPARVTARMPTPVERDRFGMVEGVPLLLVRAGGGEMLYPADRVEVCMLSHGAETRGGPR
ncbi:GntR family transcriptional regulator [Dactylosporangium sp. NPDC051541]|uniref:GntR family transcriptional regulator n=1 Tax=Dactylosporangium sp. NPDC051541 TaxID=3363977 RepID=UPI0037923768